MGWGTHLTVSGPELSLEAEGPRFEPSPGQGTLSSIRHSLSTYYVPGTGDAEISYKGFSGPSSVGRWPLSSKLGVIPEYHGLDTKYESLQRPTHSRSGIHIGFSLEVPFRIGDSVIMEGDGVKLPPTEETLYF